MALELLSDELLLAMLGWGEARGEPPVGILAVMWVAKNRSDKQDRALRDVILQPYQFSCFNTNDPNYGKLFSAEKDEPTSWGSASAIANLVLGGWTRDPTGGANGYYAGAPPPWAAIGKWIELTRIGHHTFGLQK